MSGNHTGGNRPGMDLSFYVPSFGLKQLAWSGYGFGYTSRMSLGTRVGPLLARRAGSGVSGQDEEALVSGGLLRYFKGHANERGECLSFCLWETREQARQAADAASHRSAAGVSAQSTSHTRSNVTGYRRSQRSSSSSASRIEGTDRGGKRHAPPV